VLGAVYNENDLLFRTGRRVSAYLREAGGSTRDADRSHIYIVRADGSIEGSNRASGVLSASVLSVRLQPGDTIVVPENFNKTTLIRNLKDYAQILSQFALGAAAINVLR
jgi:protein involved in polysaccharide export with SLBB domain